jgi:hypothetical protein
MLRPGLMAPPTLYDEPARAGLMSPGASAPRLELSLSAALWSVATVLAAVELCINLAL